MCGETTACIHVIILYILYVMMHVPFTPAPRTNTSALHSLTGGGTVAEERASRNPRCWKKCLRNEKRANRDASSPVLTQDPPFNEHNTLTFHGLEVRYQRLMGSITYMRLHGLYIITWSTLKIECYIGTKYYGLYTMYAHSKCILNVIECNRVLCV